MWKGNIYQRERKMWNVFKESAIKMWIQNAKVGESEKS